MFPVRAANRAILPVLCRDPELPFAARDAAPWGIGRTAASEALADLIALGFLACAREAAMLGRLARRWACSELPTMDGRGRTVPPSYAARRLSQAEVDAIVAELAAARREARKARDPDAAARAERNLRPPPRTQLSAAADTNSSGSPEPGLVSAAADANAPSEAPLCPHTRTVSISTMVSAQRGRQRSPTELAAGPASPAQNVTAQRSLLTPPCPLLSRPGRLSPARPRIGAGGARPTMIATRRLRPGAPATFERWVVILADLRG
jgi:hypothetical protein